MVENVLDPQDFERQSNQKDIVWRIAALNNVKSVRKVDPARVQELPEQSTGVFPEITEGCVSLSRHGVSVDTDSLDHLIGLAAVATPGAQNCHVKSISVQRTGLVKDAGIRRDRSVFHDDEDSALHRRSSGSL